MVTTSTVPAHTVDPRTLLSDDELTAVRVNVENAPPLTPRQLDLVATMFRPRVRAVLAARRPTA